MAERTRDQILDQAVYAAASVCRHYGNGFSADGLQTLRRLLSGLPWHTDAGYLADVREDDPHADFASRIIPMHPGLDFNEVVEESRG